MRIILVTSNSFAAQVAMRNVLLFHKGLIKGVVIVTQLRGSKWQQVSRFWTLFQKKSFRFLWFKFVEAVIFPRWVLITGLVDRSKSEEERLPFKEYLKKNKIPFQVFDDVNSPGCKSWIKSINADLLISAYGTQIFGEELIGLVPKAINLHGSLLPKYRGSAPYFWVVANQEKEAGITIHELTPVLDGGDILVQRAIPIRPSMSVYAVHYALCRLAGEALSDTISAMLRGDKFTRTPQIAEGDRERLPERKDMRSFRGSLITGRDFLTLR